MPTIPKREKDRPWKPKRERSATSDQAFIKSAIWQRLSRSYRTLNPLCELCLIGDVFTDATPGSRKGVTDHIIRRDELGALYDQRNLCTMCKECHDRKSSYEGKASFNIPFREVRGERLPINKQDALRLIHKALDRFTVDRGE